MTSNCSKLAKQHKTKVAVLNSIELVVISVHVRQFKDGRGLLEAISAVLPSIGFACTSAGRSWSVDEHFKMQSYII